MHLTQPLAELYIPDGLAASDALARTTHLAIGAHQDDLEIMAYHGIQECFQKPDHWFTGVVVTNGSGAPTRSGPYAGITDERMVEIRRLEQKRAAYLGDYAAQFLLEFPSSAVKSAVNQAPVEDLIQILEATRPQVVYTHNLADKHDTHVGVTMKVIAALRALPKAARPQQVFGCEVWRDLDWMIDTDKVAHNVSERENLQLALLGVFDSQVAGGKRYDLATLGRRRAHATYHESHGVDAATGITFAMDLTPLIQDDTLSPTAHVQAHIQRFHEDVTQRIARCSG